MKGLARKAIFFGSALGFLASSVKYLVFSGFTTYLSDEEYLKSSGMSHDDRMHYLGNEAENTGFIESVGNGVKYQDFWVMYISDFLLYSMLVAIFSAAVICALKFNKAKQ